MKTPYQPHSDHSSVSLLLASGRQRSRLPKILFACSVATLVAQIQAQAAVVYWDTTTTGLWSTAANWSAAADTGGSGAGAPATSGTAVFNQSSVNGNETVQLNAAATVAAMIFNNTGTTLLESNSSTPYTLTTGAITVSSGAGAVTIGDATNILKVSLNQAINTFTLNSNLTLVNTVTDTYSGSAETLTVNGAGVLTLGNYNIGNAGTGKTLLVNGSANVQIGGVVADNSTTASNLTYAGSGTLTLTNNNNTYTGATTITSAAGITATLSIGNLGSLGVGTPAMVMGGGGISKLSYTGSSATWTRGISISNANTSAEIDTTAAGQTLTISTGNITFAVSSETLILGGAGNTTISSNIIGNGAITKKDSGAVLLTGSNGTGNSGAITISGGMLQFGGTNALMSGTASSWTAAKIKVSSGATVAFNVGGAGEFTAGSVTTLLTNLTGTVANNGLQAGSSIGFDTTNAGGNFTIDNVIKDSTGTGGGAVGVTKLGSGMLTLNGANTYTGATTVTTGTIYLGGSLAGGVNVQGSGVLTGTGSVAGTVANSGAISGNLTFNNDVTVNGGASASAKAFNGNIVNNGTISSAVNVQSGKILSGTGSVTNSVTVSGTTSAGNGSDTGVMTLDLTYNPGATANFNVSSTSNGSGLTAKNSGLSYSQVVVSGSAGAVNLQIGNGTAATQRQADGSSNSGVTLEVTLSLADYATLVANATNHYALGGEGANTDLDNFFVFKLESGLVAGQFQTLDIKVDGINNLGTIFYSGTNNHLGATPNLGDVYVTVGGITQEFAVSYTGNYATNSTFGGNDIVLTAVPEPGTWAIAVGGGAMLLLLQRRRRNA